MRFLLISVYSAHTQLSAFSNKNFVRLARTRLQFDLHLRVVSMRSGSGNGTFDYIRCHQVHLPETETNILL